MRRASRRKALWGDSVETMDDILSVEKVSNSEFLQSVQHTPSSATRPGRSRSDSLGQQCPGGRESHSRHQFHLMLAAAAAECQSPGVGHSGSRIRNIECGSWSARDSRTRRLRQRLSHFLQGPGGASHGVFRLRFAAPLFERTTHQSRRSAHVCRRLDDLKCIRTIGISHCRVSQLQQQQQHTHDDSTRLLTTQLGNHA
jgi:hypothetical protein